MRIRWRNGGARRTRALLLGAGVAAATLLGGGTIAPVEAAGPPWPGVPRGSEDYSAYGSRLYDDASACPPSGVTPVGTVIYDQFGPPFRTQAGYGAPWGRNEAFPRGMPSSYAQYEGVFPSTWTGWDARGTKAAQPWFVVNWTTESQAAQGSGLGVEVRNGQLWARVAGRWVQLASSAVGWEGAHYDPGFNPGGGADEGSTGPIGFRSEGSGHGRFDMRWGVNAHAWTKGWPRPGIPAGADALFLTMEMRLVGDVGSARPFTAHAGIDAYDTTTSTGTRNPFYAAGRQKYVTPCWQPFTAITLPTTKPGNAQPGLDYWSAILDAGLPDAVLPGTGAAGAAPGAPTAPLPPVQPGVPPVSVGIGPAQQYVRAAYRHFLGRPADDAEATYWGNALVRGLEPPRFIRELVVSDEWSGHIVDRFYRDTLGRGGDPSGRAYWTGRLRGGVPVATVASGFYGSEEYVRRSGGDAEGWIRELYRALLGREPDRAGLAYWTDRVHDQGRERVAWSFFQSHESRGRRVDELYRTLLGRPAEPEGRTYWSTVLLDGDDLRLATFLASSPEYTDRAISP